MSQPNFIRNRREFLKLAAGAAGIVIAGLPPRRARADELPHVAESDPTAAALGYKEDTTKVDKAKYPNHTPEQTCAKCKFFQGTAGYSPCQLLPGKSVHAKGWCSAYAAKA